MRFLMGCWLKALWAFRCALLVAAADFDALRAVNCESASVLEGHHSPYEMPTPATPPGPDTHPTPPRRPTEPCAVVAGYPVQAVAVAASTQSIFITRSAARRGARPCPEEHFQQHSRRRRAQQGTARRWYVGPAMGAAAPTPQPPRFPWRRRMRLQTSRHHRADTRPCRRCASAFLTPGPR